MDRTSKCPDSPLFPEGWTDGPSCEYTTKVLVTTAAVTLALFLVLVFAVAL